MKHCIFVARGHCFKRERRMIVSPPCFKKRIFCSLGNYLDLSAEAFEESCLCEPACFTVTKVNRCPRGTPCPNPHHQDTYTQPFRSLLFENDPYFALKGNLQVASHHCRFCISRSQPNSLLNDRGLPLLGRHTNCGRTGLLKINSLYMLEYNKIA